MISLKWLINNLNINDGLDNLISWLINLENSCVWLDNDWDILLNCIESFSAYVLILETRLLMLFIWSIIDCASFNVLFSSSFNSGINFPSNVDAAAA